MKTLSLLTLLALAGCHDHDHDHGEVTPGASDALALRACAAHEGSTIMVQAAATAEDAPTVIIEPETAYAVTVSGAGFVTFRSNIEHYDWAVFSEGAATLSIAELTPQAPVPSGCNADLQDHRVHVHAVEDYLMEISGEGVVWLYTARAASSHAATDGGLDGSHHHEGDAGTDHHHDGGTHEDAGHEHEHDAGHEHEHDAGHDHEH